MFKIAKKWIAVLMCLTMVIAIAGCTGASPSPSQPAATSAPAAQSQAPAAQSQEPAAPTEVGVGFISPELLTLRAFAYVLDNQSVDFPTMWFYTELEKETNIHIEWEMVKQADWDTTINLMFASGDYPDMILRGGTVDIEEYGVSQGILIPLDEYIPANMPNYYSRLYMNNANEPLPASDGQMYRIGNLIAQNVNHEGNDYINKTWLEKVGMDIPTTIDELTEVLRAFRDQDPNGNGEKDELPMSGGDLINGTQGVYTHFAKFGVPLYYTTYATVDAADKVQFHGYYPGFRAACEWLNMLYTEKLFDPESITQDSNVWATKVNAGNVGYTTYLRLINTALTEDTIQNFVSILPPASEYGVQVPRILEVPGFGAALTIANEHVAETLQWIDRQLETERMMVSYNGPIHEGGPIAPTMELIDGKYNILSVPENNGLYSIVPVSHAQFFAPGDYYFDVYEMPPHRVERFNTSREYEEAGVLEPKSFYYLGSLVKFDNETAIERTRLYNEIHKFMQETISSFITNGVTDASWDTYLKNCENIGVQKYIDIYQEAYDRYLATQG